MKQPLVLVVLLVLGLVTFLVIRDRGKRAAKPDPSRVVMGPDGKFTVLPAPNANWSITVNQTSNTTSSPKPGQ